MKVQRRFSVSPQPATLLYLAFSALFFGAALGLGNPALIDNPSNRDVWQHAAALRALMADLADPQNPFVTTKETSRHFHPLWVGFAALGLAFDLSVWALLGVISVVSAALFAFAVFVFGRVYFQAAWAPVVLLILFLFGWAVQVEHTGFQSFQTLTYGMTYPASFMISFSLLLWALVIKALAQPRLVWLIGPFAGFCFATHQLGALIGLTGAVAFALFWPGARLKTRAPLCVSMIAGLGLALLWPYFNPLALVLAPGHSTWSGGPRFYTFAWLTVPFIPAIFGLWGLRDPQGLPLLVALLAFLCAFLLGFAGVQIAARFMMPMTLVLQIGLAGLILRLLYHDGVAVPRRLAVLCLAGLGLFGITLSDTVDRAQIQQEKHPGAYRQTARLTADIPDMQAVAAPGLAVWPVVATGQRAMSVPWPEPGIADLAARQAANRALFADATPMTERLAIARAYGVRSLIVDTRFVGPVVLGALAELAVAKQTDGPLVRFDLP